MLLHRHGAAVRLVNGDTAHRCWQTVAANMLFRRLRIRGSALRRGWIDEISDPPRLRGERPYQALCCDATWRQMRFTKRAVRPNLHLINV